MHGVNLDLLRTLPHHPDGRPKDPHAHHSAELRARLRAARRQHWLDRIARLRRLFVQQTAPGVAPCSRQLP
ncbi:MAG: hypothetical protein U1E58_06905 [Tabrizicola sp.]